MRQAMSFERAPQIRQILGYRKFTRDKLKVAVLDSGYHLQYECARSLRALGHTVKSISFDLNEDFQHVFARILRALAGFKPDFLLTINHLGFDQNGALGAFVEQMQIPVAVWYVDSPFFVLRAVATFAQSVTTTFLWDDAYAPALKRLGAQDVHYLPLAADTGILGHNSATSVPYRPILFVGDSMQYAEAKWTKRVASEALMRCAQWTGNLLRDRSSFLGALDEAQLVRREHCDMLALATFRATGMYRKLILEALPVTSLHLIGDEGWTRLFPQAKTSPAVPYGAALAKCYQSAQVNINATSLQMPCAVNQRVFDIPAAGAFVLTDAQNDMTRHFTLPQDYYLFRSAQHAQQLAEFYLKRDELRQRITVRLREQILQRHTYTHRLNDMVRRMRQRHAMSQPASPEAF